MQGKLIVFEGGEGGGKSTQLMRLKDWLLASSFWAQRQGGEPPVVTTREPGGTALGARLRALLLNTQDSAEVAIANRSELLLYAADRAQHVAEFITPHLEQGDLVLCDRYTASTVAYQGYGRGLDLGLIKQLNQIATAGVTCDLTLWLDLDVSIGLERVRQRGETFDRMETGEVAFHQRIRDGFTAIAAQQPTMVQIDAARDPDTVAAHIQAVIQEYLQQWYPPLSQN
ncbi:Thymidylate kinase [Acaryochloris thomasi RCC1774]|uniref:Thymidylate kinase n=1 Tax=Acaryochloris thomasi RCC1774 TaxID=1764569 RepID=A0A2W1JZA9_9CYAN|nr:dTMP kinase [Acaryochloris thomasi]PZD75272.1 Thymidylate kinase [Acaryochloris thomasi RCC1774]